MARLAFLGTPEAAAVCMRAVAGAGHEIAIVVTEPDKRRHRGSQASATPAKAAALELGIPVSERVADALEARPELGVVVAFGRIIKPDLLDRLEMVNVHFSLLPRWRGAAPVERAILAGDEATGVCLMKVEAGLDTGPVYRSAPTPISPKETASELRTRLTVLGANLLVEGLADWPASLGEAVPQLGEPTYAAKITPEDLHLDWSRPGAELERVVRVGRAWTMWRGERLIVWGAHAREGPVPGGLPPGTLVGSTVATGAGWLDLVVVQVAGRQRQDVGAFLLGARLEPGESFS